MFCRSCGETIKKQAEICPNCGVRNEEGGSPSSENSTSTASTTSKTPSTTHDPSNYETSVSDTWWYGVAGGTFLWVSLFFLSGVAGDSLGSVVGFIALVAWIGLPLSAYFDMQYIRANAEWNPNTVLWIVLLSVWLINIVAGAVYLYRRHEVLDVP